MVGLDGEAERAESNLAVLVDGASTSDGQTVWNGATEEERCRSVRVVEILKILINFLQVTSAAALLRFNWPPVMIKILDVQDLLSGFSNGGGFFSIDCLFPAGLAVPKSILTISIGTLMPLALVVASSIFWLLSSFAKRRGWRHLLQRIIMSSLVIVYLAWWDTWNRLFRVFHCTKVDKEGGPFALASSRYWLEDTDVECFKGDHLHVVVGLAFPTFLMLCMTWGFMLGYLVLGVRRDRDRGCNISMFGFFYQGFRPERWYWDVVVMLRKLILAGLMVASYDDENGSEENIAGVSTVVLLAISLVAQAFAAPYHESAADLNHLEMTSIATSLIVFLSGVIFNHEELSRIGRIAFSVLTICSMAATLAAILCKLARAGLAGRKGAGGGCGSWLARMGRM